MYAASRRHAKAQRAYHYITGTVLLVAGISYYAMAIQEGVRMRHIGPHTFRWNFNDCYYYANEVDKCIGQDVSGKFAGLKLLRRLKDVDWLITTPLLLLDLALLAGLSPIDTILLVYADAAMVLTGAFAAMTRSAEYQWGFFAFSCVFYLYVLYSVLVNARSLAAQKSNAVGQLFTSISVFTIVIWSNVRGLMASLTI